MIAIQIQIRSVYGEDKAYPANGPAAHIAKIAGTKTLTRATLANVLAMGLTVEELDRYGIVTRSHSAADGPHATNRLPAIA